MVEMGYCIGRCTNFNKCFFVKKYFMCDHLMCYNLAIKFKCCIKCGNHKFRNIMNNINDDEVVMYHTILKKTYCHCIKC